MRIVIVLCRLFLGDSLCFRKGITEIESDVEGSVLMDDDAVDELREERSGEGADVAVMLEMFDEVIRFVRSIGIGKGGFEAVDVCL